MVKIRLRRTGKKKQPSYRLVVADSRTPRDGRFIEIIGHYIPIRQPKVINIKADRARYWLSVGAQPSDTVANLFKQVNILDSEGRVTAATEESEYGFNPPVAEPVAASGNGQAPALANFEATEVLDETRDEVDDDIDKTDDDIDETTLQNEADSPVEVSVGSENTP